MAYHRGHPKDYDDWAAAGNAGWSWNEVLPYFRLSENNADRRDADVHGIDGPIHVTYIPKPNRLNQAFLDAFAAVGGYRHCDDFTGLDPEGYGLRQGTIHRGRRDSTASALLVPALRRPNLTVLTRTSVTGIRIEAGRATGVDVFAAAGPHAVAASREVLLCAGAVHSPQLLMLSGIGPARHLESLGIARQGRPGRCRCELSRSPGGPDRTRDARHHLLRTVMAYAAACVVEPRGICTRAPGAPGEQCVRVDRIHSQRPGRRSSRYPDRVSAGAP